VSIARTLILTVLACALGTAHAATPTRRPAAEEVLVVLPERGHPRSDAVQQAIELQRLGTSTRDVRYFGRAESILGAKLRAGRAPVPALIVQARLLQRRHQFKAAAELLDQALARNPDNTQATVLRAGVRLTQGEVARARTDCTALLRQTQIFVGTVCLAQVLAANGDPQQARDLLDTQLASRPVGHADGEAAEVLSWALGIRAEIAQSLDDSGGAELDLRAALALQPASESLRVALADLLLTSDRAAAAASLLNLPFPSPALLMRQIQVAQAGTGGDTAAIAKLRRQLDQLLDLDRLRGDDVHLREQAQVALLLDRDACRAADLARRNAKVQRESTDMRLLDDAVTACGRATVVALRR